MLKILAKFDFEHIKIWLMKKINYYDREIACLVAYLEKEAPTFLKEKVDGIKFTNYEVSKCIADGLLAKRIVSYPNGFDGHKYMPRLYTTPKGKQRIKEWALEHCNSGVFIVGKKTLKCEIAKAGSVRECTFKEKIKCIKDLLPFHKDYYERSKLGMVLLFILSNFTPYQKIKSLIKRTKI